MSLIITILVAFAFFLLALALVAIGWLITGKMKVKIGACGRVPDKDNKCGEETKCSLCDEGKKEKDDLQ